MCTNPTILLFVGTCPASSTSASCNCRPRLPLDRLPSCKVPFAPICHIDIACADSSRLGIEAAPFAQLNTNFRVSFIYTPTPLPLPGTFHHNSLPPCFRVLENKTCQGRSGRFGLAILVPRSISCVLSCTTCPAASTCRTTC